MRKILLVCLLFSIAVCAQARGNPEAQSWLKENSLSFTENKGQIVDTRGNLRPDVLFTSAVNGSQVYFRKDAVSYVFPKVEETKTNGQSITALYRMDLEFVGANANVEVASEGALPGVANYYTTAQPALNVKSYGRIVYKNLYDNIDLVFYPAAGKDGAGLKYDFVVRPGGNPADIQLRHAAATKVGVNGSGQLVAKTPFGNVTDNAPYTFVEGTDAVVSSAYAVNNGIVSFNIGDYDQSKTLVIDPFTTVASTYYGSPILDQAYGIAVDNNGNATITGYTQSASFPTTTGLDESFAGANDAFVVSFDANGSRRWSTFLGGSSIDQGNGIAVDNSGAAYITGVTASNNIASGNAHQSSLGGGSDAFVAKFGTTGQLDWSTYYGAAQVDQGLGIDVASNGDVYVTGVTYSTGFSATTGQTTFGGSRDAFIVKFNSNGQRQWAGFYGGSAIDIGNAVVVDAANMNVYIAGQTASSNNIATNGSTFNGGSDDMFIASFNAMSGARNWGGYYGGSGTDIAYAINTDAAGNLLMGGSSTNSAGLATPGAAQGANAGQEDGIVAKLSNTGAAQWLTYYGGTAIDRVLGVASNSSNDVFFTGLTYSSDFPADNSSAGRVDAFVVKLNGSGSRVDANYYGGSSNDIGRAIEARDGNSTTVYVAGQTISLNFPTQNAFQSNRAGNDDAFVLWLNSDNDTQDPCANFSISASANGTTITANTNDGSSATWTLNGGQQRSGSNASWSGLAAGQSYTVSATNGNNCSDQTVIDIPNGGTCLSIAGANVIGSPAGQNQGSISLQVINTEGLVNYAWSSGQNSPSISGLAPGSYSVTVSDASNCPAVTATYTVDVINQGGFQIRPISGNLDDLIYCEDGSVTLAAVNAPVGSYMWMRTSQSTGSTVQVGSDANYTSRDIAGAYSYQLIVNTGNGQFESNVLSVVVNPNPNISVTGTGVICSGAGSTDICGVAQENVVFRLYDGFGGVRGPQADPCFAVSTPGVYILNALNNVTGCEENSPAINVITVPGPAAPTVTPNGNTNICGGTSVTLTRSNEAGFTYQWRRDGNNIQGATGATIEASQSGCYTVVATATNGCQAVSQPVCVTISNTPDATISVNGPTNFCTADQVNTTLVAPGVAGNVYSWRRDGGIVQEGPSNVLNVQSAGTYSVIVTNAAGCSSISDAITINVNSIGELMLETNDRTDYCSGENINVLLCAQPQVPTYEYQFFRNGQPLGQPQNNPCFIASQPGTYVVQAVSGNCSSVSLEPVIINSNPRPIPTIEVAAPGLTTICEDGFVELVANEGADLSYQWVRNGEEIVGANNRTLEVREIGSFNYSVIVTRLGCASVPSTPILVTVYPKPDADLVTPTLNMDGEEIFVQPENICLGQSLDLLSCDQSQEINFDNLVYTWRLNGDVVPGANTCEYEAIIPGIYEVEIENVRTGCKNNDDANLGVVNPPSVEIIAGGETTFCEGGAVELTANIPANAYQWYLDGELLEGENGQSIMAMENGAYRVEVIVGPCRVISPTPAIVNVTPRPDASYELAGDGSTNFCTGDGDLFLQARELNGESYQWWYAATEEDELEPLPGETGQRLTLTMSGFYALEIMKDGCIGLTEEDEIEFIDVNQSPAAQLEVLTGEELPVVRCEGATDVVLVATPPAAGLTYTWFVGPTPAEAEVIPGFDEALFSPRETGTYWVLIENREGCSSLSNPIEVIFNEIPTVSVTLDQDSVICEDGSVRLYAEGMVVEDEDPSFSYLWVYMADGSDEMDTVSTSQVYDATMDGIYRAIASNKGCSSGPSRPLNVKVWPNPAVNLELMEGEFACVNSTLMVPSMTEGDHMNSTYTFTWLRDGAVIAGAANEAMYTTDAPGLYRVSVVNNVTGCEELSNDVMIYENPVANAGPTVTFCAGESSTLMGSATGGNGEYQFLWTEPEGVNGTISDAFSPTPTITINEAGTYVYTLQVTDSRNCVSSPLGFVTVIVNPNPVADAGADRAICLDGSVVLSGTASGGNGGPYAYTWITPEGAELPGNTTPPIMIGVSGTYTYMLRAVDGNGCVGMDDVEVMVEEEAAIIAVDGNPFPNESAAFCFGGNLVLESTLEGDLYNWYRIAPGETDTTFVQGGVDSRYTAFIGGDYVVEVIDNENGTMCWSDPFTVTVYENPVAEIFPGNTIICPNSPVTLRASSLPGYNYTWLVGQTPDVAVPAPGSTNSELYVATTPGRYWALITVAEGCSTLSEPVDVTESQLAIDVALTQPMACGDNSGVINVTTTNTIGLVSYRLNGGPAQASGQFSGLVSGDYNITIEEAGGCVVDTMVNLNVMAPQGLVVDPNSITDNSAVVSWNFVSGGGEIRYNLRYRVIGAEDWMMIENINGTVQLLSELQQDTDYEVEVQTECQTLEVFSGWSRTTFTTAKTQGVSCETPSDIYVNIRTAPNGVPTVYWDLVDGAACYDLEYRTVTPLGSWIRLQVNEAQQPFPLLGLLPNTDYEVRMRSHCTFCNSLNQSPWSPNIPFTVPGECDVDFELTINDGINDITNCGPLAVQFEGQIRENYGFQWRVDGIPIGGATMPDYTITSSGNYDLVLTIGNCDPIYSNVVVARIFPEPEVIANVSQNVSCIDGNDGVIVAGCVDVVGRPCNLNPVGYEYILTDQMGNIYGPQENGVFTGLMQGFYTATIVDLESGCSASYADAQYTTVTAPEAATFVSINAISFNTAEVTWNNVRGANAYDISYRPVGSGEQNWTDVRFDGGGAFPGTSSLVLNNLQNGTEYDIRVRSRCATNNLLSGWSGQRTFTTPSLPGCGTADANNAIPGGVFAIVDGETTTTISYNAVAGASCYQVRYRQLGQDDTQWSETPATTQLSTALSGLLPNTTYEFEVRAICGDNCAGTPSSWTATRTFTTLFFNRTVAEEAVAATNLTVYPNPNNGSFNVSFNATSEATASIELVDVTGRVAMNRAYEVSEGANIVPVELNGFASGVYILNFTIDGEVSTVKVILQ